MADYDGDKKIDELADVSAAITKASRVPVQDMNDTDKTGYASIESVVNKGLAEPGGVGGTTPAAGTFTTLQGYYQSVENKTDNYTVQAADLGKTLRMNSADDKTFTLCSVGASEDGARLTFVKLGAGKVTIDAADSDIISDSGAGDTIYNDVAAETYATITIEYVHGSTKWVVIGAHGTWTTTD